MRKDYILQVKCANYTIYAIFRSDFDFAQHGPAYRGALSAVAILLSDLKNLPSAFCYLLPNNWRVIKMQQTTPDALAPIVTESFCGIVFGFLIALNSYPCGFILQNSLDVMGKLLILWGG